MSESEYDWRGNRALSYRADLITLLLRLLEDSHEMEKRLGLRGIPAATEEYQRRSREILKLIDELRLLMVEKHPDSLNNLDA